MNVLGIETSCDETAASVVGAGGALSDIVYSQAVHAAFGGVVPELASRAHLEKIDAVVQAALQQAGIRRPDAIAATAGPGLIGALLVGLSYAKALAAGWAIPLIAVNHLEGHMLSPLLETPAPDWPFVCLVVSGGHTALYACRALSDYTLLGTTVDDAAGEAYDKVARLLGLGYPGGPVVDALAAKGNPQAVAFPRPLPGQLNFSFSGLKTAVRTHVLGANRASDPDICASFQAAVIDVLVGRVQQAMHQTGIDRVSITGGVAANSGLRKRIQQCGAQVFLPPRNRCTDNAAMIASVGRERLLAGFVSDLDTGARSIWPAA